MKKIISFIRREFLKRRLRKSAQRQALLLVASGCRAAAIELEAAKCASQKLLYPE